MLPVGVTGIHIHQDNRPVISTRTSRSIIIPLPSHLNDYKMAF